MLTNSFYSTYNRGERISDVVRIYIMPPLNHYKHSCFGKCNESQTEVRMLTNPASNSHMLCSHTVLTEPGSHLSKPL